MHIAIVNSMNYCYIIISFDFIYISYRLLLDIDISTYLLTYYEWHEKTRHVALVWNIFI